MEICTLCLGPAFGAVNVGEFVWCFECEGESLSSLVDTA
jgi:hypothetical protein